MKRDNFTFVMLPQKNSLTIDNPINNSRNNTHFKYVVKSKTLNNQEDIPLLVKVKRKMFYNHYSINSMFSS